MLELAARLRELPRDDLAAALHSRQFEPNGVHDLFDLAELLLSPDSLDHAISRLDRRRLAVLAAAAELAAGNAGGTTVDAVHGELVRLAASDDLIAAANQLLDRLDSALLVVIADGHVHVPVALTSRLVPRLGDDLPSTAELAAPAPPVLVTADEVDRSILERRSSESAYATVAATAELLSELGTQPARELAKGEIGRASCRERVL